ncbi:MAG: DMT family transporter [Pseudomonadota bacterium]
MTSNLLRAGLWMLGAIVSFSAMAVAGREVAPDLNTFELMFYRSVIGFALVLGLVAASPRGWGQLATKQPRQHVWRNAVHFAGQNAWFYGVAVIPLSQLVALEFTNPLWVALLAPLLLGERMTLMRAIAAALGFAGVLIVARPGIAPLEWGHAAGLAAAFFFALNTIFTRRIMGHDTVICVMFWMTASQAVMGLIFALPGGIPWPDAGLMIWVAVAGVCGLTAHYALTSALSHAPATIVAPMEFGRLPLIALLGYLLYAEPLELAVALGAVLIVAGNLLNLRSERDQARGRPRATI